jgi:hypothetical protein
VITPWDAEQARLQERAASLLDQLGLIGALEQIGSPTLVGSAALGLMVARDIDLTVAVSSLDRDVRHAIADLAHRMSMREDVREILLRNDTGRWNTDPSYPDGLYVRLDGVDVEGDSWTLDIWFVDDPGRQPDLGHLQTIGPRITPDAQAAILAIKRATRGRRPDGAPLPSIEIYEAVLDEGARSADDLPSPS